jgi:hypothetical protein
VYITAFLSLSRIAIESFVTADTMNHTSDAIDTFRSTKLAHLQSKVSAELSALKQQLLYMAASQFANQQENFGCNMENLKSSPPAQSSNLRQGGSTVTQAQLCSQLNHKSRRTHVNQFQKD